MKLFNGLTFVSGEVSCLIQEASSGQLMISAVFIIIYLWLDVEVIVGSWKKFSVKTSLEFWWSQNCRPPPNCDVSPLVKWRLFLGDINSPFHASIIPHMFFVQENYLEECVNSVKSWEQTWCQKAFSFVSYHLKQNCKCARISKQFHLLDTCFVHNHR